MYKHNHKRHQSEMRQQPHSNPNRNYAAHAPVHTCHHSASGMSYRSAAEAQLDTNSKYRQLPCKTLISIGTCPFGERCVFLHDPRLICHLSHSISRLKNKEDSTVDSYFWPLTSHELAPGKKNDHNFRPYSVPAPKNDQYRLHDQALYSLWMHYVEFCRASAKPHKSSSIKTTPQDLPLNIFSQRPRLPVFQLLSSSNGCSISREQFHFATFERMRELNTAASTATANTSVAAAALKAAPVASAQKLSPSSVSARPSTFIREQQGQLHKIQHHQQHQQHQQQYYGGGHAQLSSAVSSLGTSSGFTSFCSDTSADSTSGGNTHSHHHSSSNTANAAHMACSSSSLFDDLPQVEEEGEDDREEEELSSSADKALWGASPRAYRSVDCIGEVQAALQQQLQWFSGGAVC